jgi:protein-tyrosine kinase
MSVIDQAAKRLQELQRAGVELPARDTGPEAPLPTPEAMVRALESRERPVAAASPELALPPRVESAEASKGKPAVRSRRRVAARGTPTTRHVELDLAALTSRGFISPDSPTQIADEFRVIKRPLIRNAVGKSASPVKNGNLIMVTSALPGEGKTFTSVNLAMSIALEFDSTVLLVDGDVAHPQLPNLLGIPSSPGLLDLLTRDDIDVGDTLIKTNVEKLTIMPAGSRHRQATELLASEQMVGLLHELGARYPDRIVIFDSPPLLATTEARVLAGHMGQILMVVSADSTARATVQAALTTIENCDIVLMMLNKASKTEVGTYYGYY